MTMSTNTRTINPILISFVLVVVVAMVTASMVSASTGTGTYTVQPGDSLTRIARKLGTTIDILLDLNKVQYPCLTTNNGSCLQAGWTLAVPTANVSVPTGDYVVQPGDSLARIAARTGTTIEALVANNKQQYPCLATNPICMRAGWVLVVSGSAMPAPTATASNTPASPSAASNSGSDYWSARKAIAEAVNKFRTDNGLNALAWDDSAANAAQGRTDDMVARQYFSHFDPATGAKLALDAIFTSGFSYGCENLFGSTRTLNNASKLSVYSVQWWANSTGHKQCMLQSNATAIGVGVAPKGPPNGTAWIVALLLGVK